MNTDYITFLIIFCLAIIFLTLAFNIIFNLARIKSLCNKAEKKLTNRRMKQMIRALKYFNVFVPYNEKKEITYQRIRSIFIDNNENQNKYSLKIEKRINATSYTKDKFLIAFHTLCDVIFTFSLIFIGIGIYVFTTENYINRFNISSYLNQENVVSINTDYYRSDLFHRRRLIEINSSINDTIMVSKYYNVKPNQKYLITSYIRVDLLYDDITKEELMENYKKYSCAGIRINNQRITLLPYAVPKTNIDSGVSESGENFYKISYYFESSYENKILVEYYMGNYEHSKTYCRGRITFDQITLTPIDPQPQPWNILWAIIDSTNIQYKNYNLHFTMNRQQIDDFKNVAPIFENTMNLFTNNALSMNIDVIHINDTIRTLRTSESIGYELSCEEIFGILKSAKPNIEEYDHFFVMVKLGDSTNYVSSMDWAGYGGQLCGNRGLSVIRTPQGNEHPFYMKSANVSRNPETIFIHELLHTMEFISDVLNLFMPRIHDHEYFGYKYENDDFTINEYYFFKDLMQNNIIYNNEKVGVPPILWKLRPSIYYYKIMTMN